MSARRPPDGSGEEPRDQPRARHLRLVVSEPDVEPRGRRRPRRSVVEAELRRLGGRRPPADDDGSPAA